MQVERRKKTEVKEAAVRRYDHVARRSNKKQGTLIVGK